MRRNRSGMTGAAAAALAALLLLAACSDDETPPPQDGAVGDVGITDTTAGEAGQDAPVADTGSNDAPIPADGAHKDSSPKPDAIPPSDGGGKKCGPFAGGQCSKTQLCDITGCATGATGVCVPVPTGCPKIYQPVCGCNGTTYDNNCFRQVAGVALDHTGACKQADAGSDACQVDCDCTQGLTCVPTSTGNKCIAAFLPVYCCTKPGCPTGNACSNPDGSKGTCP